MDDCLGVIEPEVATFLAAEVPDAEELNFEATSVIALSKKWIYNVQMCFGITSNILQPLVSVLDKCAAPKPNLHIIYRIEMAQQHSPDTQDVPWISI